MSRAPLTVICSMTGRTLPAKRYAMLARIIRIEAEVKPSMQKPKTVEEALAKLEGKVGTKGRRKFERFLREAAEDKDEDAIDVESK
jgi:hypothetical protein